MKTNELTGAALDWAVAKCEGHDVSDPTWWPTFWADCCYSTDWVEAGAIIERECINIVKNESGKYWQAASEKWMLNDGHPSIGETPLIAAMRCYVESELGDDVEVPEELLDLAHE